MTASLLCQLMVLLFSNPLLFGDQKYHGVLDLSKIRQDQCVLIDFKLVKYG